MEHEISGSASQSADVGQQTDETKSTEDHENFRADVESDPVMPQQDEQIVLQAEGPQSLSKPSDFKFEEQSHLSEEPTVDDGTRPRQEETIAMHKESAKELQSRTYKQEEPELHLNQEFPVVEQQLTAEVDSNQTGQQMEQDSSMEQQESTEQDPHLVKVNHLEMYQSLSEQYKAIAEKADFITSQNVTELEKNIPSEMSNSTATVKVMLVPDGQVVTMAFSIGYSVENLKNYFAAQMKIPALVIQILFEGHVVEDQETLLDLGVTPHGTIQLEMLSLDPENYPMKTMKLQHEYSMPDVITVRVQTGEETFQDLVVEIERLNYRKPYLGGYRHKVTGAVFHHAGTQTVPKKRPGRGVVVFCRDTQTVFEKNKIQQSRNSMSTQMTKIGCYVANITDTLLEPKRYLTADEFHARRLKAIIKIQTYFRRFHAKRVVQQLREEQRLRLEWEEKEEKRKRKEREERLRREYERRMNPKTKEDFELLYHALELWRKEEIERINQTSDGAERKASLCALLEQETQLIASIGRHKINTDEENKQNAVQHFLSKCCQPKRWKAFDGKTTEMDTQYTIRARELQHIYNSINTKNVNQDERLDALLTLKHTVKEHDCKLTQEIVDLIDREADLLMRGVQDRNLDGLRKRISTLFLQYIKIPTFNPEVAKLLKVPQDSSVLRKNIYFCHSCKSYLPSTEFSLSANARTVGRCRKCAKLDNEAREREEFTKFKILLKQLKKSEADYGDEARIAFLLQQQDLQHLVVNIWAAHSVISACDDLYELAMVRWDKYCEWSPWNCILLTKDEASAHLNLSNADQAYGTSFIQRIKHRHTLARNYFSQIPEMAPFLHGENSSLTSTINDLITTKTIATISHS
ncbi:IQ motif and ubiquitin-like domain-containing protein [Pelodytes ibericus]